MVIGTNHDAVGSDGYAVPECGPFRLAVPLAGLAAAAVGGVVLQLRPDLELGWFAGGAARLASLFTGVAAVRVDAGWLLAFRDQSVVVTAACSGADYFLIVAALLGWRMAQRVTRPALVIAPALALAVPLTLLINALRVVAVIQAHRWVIPRLPETYAAFAHLLTGVAVFLPSLIALNLILESHGNTHRPSAAS